MKHPKRLKRTHIPTPIVLPNHWSAKQAAAVFEILDELMDGLCAQYGAQIHSVMRKDREDRCHINMGEVGEPF